MSNSKHHNMVVWFEIPVVDIERAIGFYEKILGTTLKREPQGDRAGAVFPYAQPGVSGSLVAYPDQPSRGAGAIVYLNVDGELDKVAGRVAGAGGKLLTPKIELPDGQGAFFQMLDSEGNRVGIHAAT